MLEVFIHLVPEAEGFALSMGEMWAARPEQPGGSQGGEASVPQTTNHPPAVQQEGQVSVQRCCQQFPPRLEERERPFPPLPQRVC